VKTLVVGLGDTGLSALRWLAARGVELRATDSRATPPHADALRAAHPNLPLTLGAFRADDFAWAEQIVVSPGVPVATPLIAQALQAGRDVVGDVELFARELLAPGLLRQSSGQASPLAPKVIAITGSNGKSTVTSMCGDICRHAGLATAVAGNIGLPVLDALPAPGARGPDIYVLELSSFQLETTASLAPSAATVLNVSEDHMDRYAGLDDYAAAKARIYARCGTALRNRDDARTMAMPGGARAANFGLGAARGADEYGFADGWLTHAGEPLMPASELPVAGLHNVANALAALALAHAAGIDHGVARAALRAYRGLPHRVAKVAELDGVGYFDDSKGTNVGATLAALTGMGRPVVLIAGGDGKGQDFAPLRDALAQHARALVLIGRDAPAIRAAVAGSGIEIVNATSLEEAVRNSRDLARPGDAVLLSPACASFDMFRNYVHRAEVFVAAVRALA
jgi:UDP-N-acetylmuramoylalanine--D-glutamate ligase